MRKPKLANQDSAFQHSNSVRYFAIAVILLTACSLALSGCSKFRFQEPTSFKPMPQPRSLSQRQQRSAEEALAKQDATRLAAADAETAAEALAAAEGIESPATETAASSTPESEETQQQDIVADAAQRASFKEAMTQVAQVSYETEVDKTEGNESQPDSAAVEPNSEMQTSSDSVRLMANADDLEGVPANFAGDDIDFSQANFLRPSAGSSGQGIAALTDESEMEAVETAATPFGNAESLQLPLQPMLFNADTRTTKSTYEGTLRPLTPYQPNFESEVAVAKFDNAATNEALPSVDSLADPSRTFGTLAPLRIQASTIKLESSQPTASMVSASNSRLLRPIGREAAETAQPPEVESATVEATTAEATEIAETTPEPIIESAEIFVVDPPNEFVAPEPRVAEMQIAPMPSGQKTLGQPVVDESLSTASASDLEPMKQVVEAFAEETFIPAEIFEDATIVAEDMERELTATAIPSESDEEENNDFKVQAVSNTSVTSICRGCGSETCAGCEIDDRERGEPMFTNNDFAAPAIPGRNIVAPMAIPPATVPTAPQPEKIIPASSEFGSPISHAAPPESDTAIAHVAALPIVRHDVTQPTSTSNVPPVGISTLMELNAVTWKSRLDQAIELADERLGRMKTPTDSGRVNLRLLKALRGQMEQVENAPGSVQFSENESQYWQHQLEAITAMLQTPAGDNQAVTDYLRHQTAHETLEHLRNAVAELESIASLKVTSGQFCTEVSGFGQYRTFPSTSFSPGQKMLIYCEVENYKTVENQSATGGDFRTRLRGSFAIYDSNGKVAQQAEFPSVDDVARKRRRDFYMYLPVTLADLPQGQYVLHAMVEDIYGNKTASLDPPLKFSVK